MATAVSNGHVYPSFYSIDALLGAQKMGVQGETELRIPNPHMLTRAPQGISTNYDNSYGQSYLYGARRHEKVDDLEDSDEMDYINGQHAQVMHKERQEHNGM